MKKIVFVALFTPIVAYAVDVEILLGVSKYRDSIDGLWYVENFNHDMTMVAPAIEGGIAGKLWGDSDQGFSVDYHADLVYAGAIHIDAAVPTQRTTNTRAGKWVGIDFKGSVPNPCYGVCNNMSDFSGDGYDAGLGLVLAPTYTTGSVKFSVLAGMFEHRSVFKEQLTNIYWTPTDQARNYPMVHTAKFQTGREIGVAVDYKNVLFKYEYLSTPAKFSDLVPQAWQHIHTVLIGYKF